jgi:hypothetical protein
MGRRKIEIEPITVSHSALQPPRLLFLHCSCTALADFKGLFIRSQHERNRSVTFLKASSDFAIFAKRKSWQTLIFVLTPPRPAQEWLIQKSL